MKRRKRIAPVLSRFWCSSKPSSAGQAPLTSTEAPSELASVGFAWQKAASDRAEQLGAVEAVVGLDPPQAC